MGDKKEKSLAKNLGLFDAIMIVVGMVIGSGIFFKPSIVLKNAGSPLYATIAWIIGGAVAIAAGLTVAEIGAAIPKTGGLFVYLKELYGEKIGFLYGWVQSVIYLPGSMAALAIIFATEATNFVPMTVVQQRILAIGLIVFLATVNIISTKVGSKIQGIATVAKLLPLIAIVGLGIFKGTVANETIISPATNGFQLAGFGAALLGTLWAYDGWISVANIGGELKNPKKDLPKAIIIGLSATILVYVLFNVAVMKLLPMDVLVGSEKPASDAVVAVIGLSGSKLISCGILISILGALNGYSITGARIPYAMAKDGLAPYSNFFGKISDKYQTPVNATLFLVVVACLYVLSGSFNILTNMAMFVIWMFFMMAVAGIFILRTKFKHIERPYQVPLYPIVPIIGLLGGAYIIISTLISNTGFALTGVLITLLGLPVYYIFIKKNKENFILEEE